MSKRHRAALDPVGDVALPPNALAELRRDLTRLRFVVDQIEDRGLKWRKKASKDAATLAPFSDQAM
jgi:hypothetical protein